MRAPEINLEALKDTQLLTIKVRRWGNSAKCKDEKALELYLAMKNAEDGQPPAPVPAIVNIPADGDKKKKKSEPKKRVRASKTLVRCEELDNLNEAMTNLKSKAMGFAMPSFIRSGTLVIQQSLVETVDTVLTVGWDAIQKGELPAFIEAYPRAKQAAETTPVKLGGLGPLYVEKDYPDPGKLPGKFEIVFSWAGLNVPEGLPPEIRAREEQKLKDQFAEAGQQILDALRIMFADLVDHFVDRLTPVNAGEKPRRFNDTLVSNFNEFISQFSAKNIMRDTELAELVEKAKGVVAGATPERLRSDASYKEQVRSGLEKVKVSLDPMIEEIEERDFDFA